MKLSNAARMMGMPSIGGVRCCLCTEGSSPFVFPRVLFLSYMCGCVSWAVSAMTRRGPLSCINYDQTQRVARTRSGPARSRMLHAVAESVTVIRVNFIFFRYELSEFLHRLETNSPEINCKRKLVLMGTRRCIDFTLYFQN